MAASATIEAMTVFAIIIGLLVGWMVFRRNIGILLIAVNLVPYIKKNRFTQLYASSETESVYKFITLEGVDSYRKYYKLHQKAEDTSFKLFLRYYRESTRLSLRYLFIAILPAVFFWFYWYWYVLGVMAYVIGAILYEILVKNHGSAHFKYVVINVVLSDYLSRTNSTKDR